MNRWLSIWYPASLSLLALTLAMLALPHWLAGIFIVVSVLLALDARARLKDYDRLVQAILSPDQPGLDWRVMRRFTVSRCGREVLVRACHSAGYRARPMLYSLGYRWWHLVPDGAFGRQSPFFKLRFWRNALGV